METTTHAALWISASVPDVRIVALCAPLGRAIHRASKTPKCVVCDRDRIFDCRAFRQWVKPKGIKPPRYGAIGRHGSIAVAERTNRTLKDECARRILVPMCLYHFRREILYFVDWYHGHRPHTALAGRTPNEVNFRRKPAQQKPRIEPRPSWLRPPPCARPQTLTAGRPGDRFELHIEMLKRRCHLPIVTLHRVA